ncbi:hypothetical protein [Demequina litorisediminis]|uniref:hypothetical protein n=1 Tax=Demequina litorisediminis TaxID=1849022 RepID=UPI003D66BB9E
MRASSSVPLPRAHPRTSLRADVERLKRQWENIQAEADNGKAPKAAARRARHGYPRGPRHL